MNHCIELVNNLVCHNTFNRASLLGLLDGLELLDLLNSSSRLIDLHGLDSLLLRVGVGALCPDALVIVGLFETISILRVVSISLTLESTSRHEMLTTLDYVVN